MSVSVIRVNDDSYGLAHSPGSATTVATLVIRAYNANRRLCYRRDSWRRATLLLLLLISGVRTADRSACGP